MMKQTITYIVIMVFSVSMFGMIPTSVFAQTNDTSSSSSFLTSILNIPSLVSQKITSFLTSISGNVQEKNTSPQEKQQQDYDELTNLLATLHENHLIFNKNQDVLATNTSAIIPGTAIQQTSTTESLLTTLSSGIVKANGSGGLSTSLINLSTETTGTLPLSMGGTGSTSFTSFGMLYGNGSSNLGVVSPGNSGYILQSNGTSSAPSWVPFPESSSSFDSLTVDGKASFSYIGNSGHLSSSGGVIFLENSSNIGTGLGIYSNVGSDAEGNMINVKVDNPEYAQAAFYMNYDGSSNAVEIVNNGSDTSSNALAVTGNNLYDSTLGIIGNELNRSTIKVTHYRPSGGTDSSASGLSIDLKGAGTRAQGLYVDSTETGGTLGNLLRLRNESIDKFVVDYQGNLTTAGNIIQGSYGSDSSWTKYGNTTGDQFFVGTNGAFRVQRSASNSEAFRIQVYGDSQGRWRGMSDGSLQWGDGSSTQDTILKRGAAGTLWLTGGMVFNNGNGSYNTIIKGATDSNLFYANASSNFIGIGTASPKAALDIQKNALGNATLIVNQLGTGDVLAASGSGSTVFTVAKSGNVRTVGSLCVKASIGTNCSGSTAGTIYATNTTVQSADVAENYISANQLEPGDIVMPARDGNNQAVSKTTKSYQPQTIGIVSTNPGVTLNSDAQTDAQHPFLLPIALQGRVWVKVSGKNGSIEAGDFLTPSDEPGVAMKATKAGVVVAKALEGYTDTSVGKIMAFVNVSYNNPAFEETTSKEPFGSVVLKAGETEVQVMSETITPQSYIFVEPEEVPIVTAITKKTEGSFVIKSQSAQPQDVTLYWRSIK